MAEILEIAWTDFKAEDLVDQSEEIVHGTDRGEWRRVWTAGQAARRAENEGVLDGGEGYVAFIELDGQQAVLSAGAAGSSWCGAVSGKDLADVVVPACWVVIWISARSVGNQPCGSRSGGPSIWTV